MRQSIFLTKTTIAFVAFILLQSCYVQKNSETHASAIHEITTEDTFAPEDGYSNEMITVAENHESGVSSLESLSARVRLIDISRRPVERWEDNISSYAVTKSRTNASRLIADEREGIEPAIINSY